MLLSKTTQYALRVLGHLAASPGRLHTADSLHDELDVPSRYLRRLLTQLGRRGYLESVRGRAGGFRLGPETPRLRVAEIIETLEGLEPMPECVLGFDRCRFGGSCSLHDVWAEARQKLVQGFADTTLADLCHGRRRRRPR